MKPSQSGNFHSSFTSRTILFFAIVALFAFLSSLTSCGIGIKTRSMFGGKVRIKVMIAENANQNSPIALDILFVYDDKLLDRLLEMPSGEWFENREQIKRDYLKGQGLDYWGWEWVPGQSVDTIRLPLKSKAKAGIVFAKYATPGSHRFRFNPFKNIKIDLLENMYTVEQF